MVSSAVVLLAIQLPSCKKHIDASPETTSLSKNLTTNSSENEVTLVEDFIQNINYSASNPTYQFDELNIDDAIRNMEHAINYSFSKPNQLFSSQSKNDTLTFQLDGHESYVSFYEVSVKSKLIASFVKSSINSKTQLVVASINKIENSNHRFKLTLILGKIDETIQLTATPIPEAIQGDHKWSFGENINFNLSCQPGDIGAVEIIRNLGTKLMLAYRNYGINKIGVAAPPGYTIYFNNYTPVGVNNIYEFGASDVAILSKFDWKNSYIAYCQSNSRIPYQSPIFYARTESTVNNEGAYSVTFPCYIPLNALDYTFKCCLNEAFINYSISKVDDVYEFLSPSSKHLFTGFEVIPYSTNVYNGPIEHKFKFFKSTYYAKYNNPNITL